MKKMKKLSAALLCVVMLASMLSCMVLGTAAETDTGLGGPVSIEKVTPPSSGISVPGKSLPGNILIVNSDWADAKLNQKVSLKLDGVVYSGIIGANAFADIGAAAEVAVSNDTIYVAAGSYESGFSLAAVNYLKIYGPWAGVSPNDENDVSLANSARPAASAEPSAVTANPDAYNEAVFSGTITTISTAFQTCDHLTIEGLYCSGSFNLTLGNGGSYQVGSYLRNNIVNVSSNWIFNIERGMNPNVVFEDNRVLSAKAIAAIGGFMDIVVRNNYLNLSYYDREGFSSGAIYISSTQNPSSGSYALVEGNYFKQCAGIVRYDRGSSGYQIVNYSIQVRDNIIENIVAGTYLVQNRFYARHSLPGINVQVTGNEVRNIPAGTTLFNFPYTELESIPARYHYIFNINNNTFNLPVGQQLVNCEVAGTLNLAYNTYTNGITERQISAASDCEVILYPYNDGTGTVGDPRITEVRSYTYDSVTYTGELNEEEKLILLDLKDAQLDSLSIAALLVVGEGCSIKVYEDATLTREVEDQMLYFDGSQTDRYIVVSSPDGKAFSTYRFHVEKSYGTMANLVSVVEDDPLVEMTKSPDGMTYTFDMDSDAAFFDYELKVSAGATYKLYADYQNGVLLEDLGNYIPYGGYTVEVYVESEDKSASNLYTLIFNREKSALYDPSIIDVVTPEGEWYLLPDRISGENLWLAYYCNGLVQSAAFDFETTPGATYAIYSDAACTKLLSSQDEVKELQLSSGTNLFYVKVTAGSESNVITLSVENDKLSSDSTITGISGMSPLIADGTIELSVGGNTSSLSFITRNEYAVCKVYADSAKKIELDYTSTPVTDAYGHIIDVRTFSLQTEHLTSNYYVECIAEDGKTKTDYKLVLTKVARSVTYADVPETSWCYSYVMAATNAGMMAGESSGTDQIFRPGDNTTREEMATIISRMIGINPDAYAGTDENGKEIVTLPYKDNAKISEWAEGYVKVCYYYGLMSGSKESTGIYFFPQSSISREEVMVIFDRMFNLDGTYDLSVFEDEENISAWARESVEHVVASGLITGDDVGKLNPRAAITREEIATIITRALDYID